MLKTLLDEKKCFKLVCGAGNEDAKEIEKLVALYSSAGCKFFDLSAKPEIVQAAKRGLKNREGYLCVSVGIKGDPHVRKAHIDYQKCTDCQKCEKVCPNHAIKNSKIENSRCLGCGKCEQICLNNAISYTFQNKDLKDVLPELINLKIDCIELHTMNEDESWMDSWKYINENFDGILSICTARGHLSEERMIERIKKMILNRKDYTTIIQADGFPMSGGCDDYKTTLQAVATAEIVQNANLPVYIMLSGGTNSKTAELAKLCGINYNGIAIGTYARKIVSKYIEREDFLINQTVFNEALKIAKDLVEKT